MHSIDTIVDLRSLPAYDHLEASKRFFRSSSLELGHVENLASLELLVSCLPRLSSTMPHDTIYALLHVASDVAEGVTFIVDYTSPSVDVFQQFVKHCIEASQSIDIICRSWAPEQNDFETISRESQTPYELLQKESEALPTWIRTVSSLPFGMKPKRIGRMNGDSFVGTPDRSFYNASKGTLGVALFSVIESKAKKARSIIVSGFEVGDIMRISTRCIFGMVPDDAVSMSGWRQNDERVRDYFWRTLVADRGPEGVAPPLWYHNACAYWLDLCGGDDINTGQYLRERHPSMAIEYLKRVQSVVCNRHFFMVSCRDGKKLFGLAPANTLLSDTVCILHGCSVPVVLRPSRTFEDSWELIGECFVYGIMEGEAMRVESFLKSVREFQIV